MGCGASQDRAAFAHRTPDSAAAAAAVAATCTPTPTGGSGGAVATAPVSPMPITSQPSTARTESIKLEGAPAEEFGSASPQPPTSGVDHPPVLVAGVSLSHTTTVRPSDVPVSLSRPESRQGATQSGSRPSISRKASATDLEVAATNANASAPPSSSPPLHATVGRTRTVGRRSSFGGGLLASAHDEHAWRQPRAARELIDQHLAEDPHSFRDHLAIYWRLEHVPPPAATLVVTQPPKVLLVSPTPRPSVATSNHQQQLHPSESQQAAAAAAVSASPSSTPPVPSPSPVPSTHLPASSPDQVSVFLSLGPSSGAGDKIGSSEHRPVDPSISFHPMLLPYHALNGGDPTFSMQVQVWQRRVTSSSPVVGGAASVGVSGVGGVTTMTLMGYVDVNVLNLFASFERGQGLLLKAPPASVLVGQTPIPLTGTMLVVDYAQFYCHTTAALTATPSRWPSALCTPASDCLWRAQIHAIKLGVPRGCPHPSAAGSMSPPSGALMLHLKDAVTAAAQGVCFLQIFQLADAPDTRRRSDEDETRGHLSAHLLTEQSPSAGGASSASAGGSSVLVGVSSSPWRLVHTSEFLSLTRNPKFAEFQRPLTDICSGDYDRPLLMQVVLSHDAVRSCELSRSMPPDTVGANPAGEVTRAMRDQGAHVCSLVQTCTTMRELLAGKTKLKLHAPGAAPMPLHTTSGSMVSHSGGTQPPMSGVDDFADRSPSGTVTRVPTLTKDQLGQSSGGGGGALLGVSIGVGVSVVSDDPPPVAVSLGHGTLAFNISQIFSSRASLESLARVQLAELAGRSDSSSASPPPSDGFDEAGIVRSTAYLASLLPVSRRAHHRPGSHLRGPSVLTAASQTNSAMHDQQASHHHPPPHTASGPRERGQQHGRANSITGPILQRSRTSGSIITLAAGIGGPPATIAPSLAHSQSMSSAHPQPASSGMHSLLDQMGIGDGGGKPRPIMVISPPSVSKRRSM